MLTQEHGLYFWNPQENLMGFQSVSGQGCPSGEENPVTDFAWDEHRQRLYLTTESCGGFFVLDSNYQQVEEPAMPSNALGLSGAQPFRCLALSRDGKVFVGGAPPSPGERLRPTLLVYDPETNWLSPVGLPGKKALRHVALHAMAEDATGQLWLGTQGKGLLCLAASRTQLRSYLSREAQPEGLRSNASVLDVVVTANGRVWAATEGHGIWYLDPGMERFRRVAPSIFTPGGAFPEAIRCLGLDASGRLWVGTKDQGVFVLNGAGRRVERVLGRAEGLPSRRIVRITRDGRGDMWISTESGICRYQLARDEVLSLSLAEGLQASYLFEMGLGVGRNGHILVGQPHGFHMLDPERLYEDPVPFPLVLTGFRVFEQPYRQERIAYEAEPISLPYDSNFFSIDFAYLNYQQRQATPYRYHYRYRLEGYDKDWVQPEDGRYTATYTNVREGKYTFQVQVLEPERGASPLMAKELPIRIRPPWYRSYLAYGVYGLGMLLLVGGTFGEIRRRSQARRVRERRTLELQKMRELNEERSRFFANISHEFRTPLTVIQGMSQELRQNFPRLGHAEVRAYLYSIYRNGEDLLSLVNQLLDLASLEANAFAPNLAQRDVLPFFRHIMASFESFAKTREINFTLHHELDHLLMDMDAHRLRNVLKNLISNALKFTPPQGTVEVHLDELTADACSKVVKRVGFAAGTRHKGNWLHVAVVDTGPGVPPEDREHIFERFYQGKQAERASAQGTGIGLALTRELVEAFGGIIWLEANEPRGSRFRLVLPITRKAERRQGDWEQVYAPADDVALPVASEGAQDASRPLVLIVEDNDDLANYVQVCLGETYRLALAKDGEAGIAKALELTPELVVSDVMMPKKDGLTLTQTLKAHPASSHIPIILLTAKATIADRLAGLRRGADAYLTKPFLKEELLLRAEQLMEVRNRLRMRYKQGTMPPASNDPDVQQEDAFILDLHQQVEEHLDDSSLNLEALSASLGVSETQLNRKVKALTGYPPKKYVQLRRLDIALTLLKETRLNVSEVAHKVGFEDPAYFSRVFKDTFGQRPRDVREQGKPS